MDSPEPRAATRDLMRFIDACPTACHAVVHAAELLERAGFRRVDEAEPWDLATGERFYVVRNDTALVAGQLGQRPAADAGFRMIGAHTDSPGFRVKYHAPFVQEGHLQLGVEIYGGPILASWADRDLGLAGRVLVRTDGGVDTRLVCVRRPVCRIPLLAIHLDRGVNDKGLVLDAQQHLAPVIGLGEDADDGARRLTALLAGELDVEPDAVVGSYLELFDLQPGSFGGLDEEFYFSGRIDNLAGCHAGVRALLDAADAGDATRLVALFHSEEVGSATAEGAESTFLLSVMERLAQIGDGPREDFHRAVARTLLASVDGAHGIHPSHADKHEPQHKPRLNGGPVVKLNAKERYATTPTTHAHLQACAERAGVPLQRYIHRTDLPCGSTIGPLSATRLGVATADLGAPMVSMHSIREMGGVEDQDPMIRLLIAHLES